MLALMALVRLHKLKLLDNNLLPLKRKNLLNVVYLKVGNVTCEFARWKNYQQFAASPLITASLAWWRRRTGRKHFAYRSDGSTFSNVVPPFIV
eukprot:1581320-Ditylum_brightwellii.AAC.1